METGSEVITPGQAKTLDGLFRLRAQRSPDAVAYRYYDDVEMQWCQITWSELALRVARWQTALGNERLDAGSRVAVLLRNCCEWVIYEQAALGLGLVVVPLYANDRPDNIAYILNETQARVLLIEGHEHWLALRASLQTVAALQRIVTLGQIGDRSDLRLAVVHDWLPGQGAAVPEHRGSADALATIVFTSGTTGRPKGVMLSHRNILENAGACQACVTVYSDDVFLSFLPLSHMFERTVGYVLPMMAGATVAFARSIPQLSEDLVTIQPTILISVPRIYERVYGRIQDQLATRSVIARQLFGLAVAVGWREFEYRQQHRGWSATLLLWPVLKKLVADKVMARLGGRVRIAVCGGAPLSSGVARLFIGLGLNLLHGYGMTETGPVIAANSTRNNIPASVGPALQGIEVRIAENGELMTRSACVMLGYWNNPQATRDIIEADGWLHTGDRARIEHGHIFITGRVKEIIVMSNGEKVPPADIEMAITADPMIDQALVIGEGRPYLAALLVLNQQKWPAFAAQLGLNPAASDVLSDARLSNAVVQRVAEHMQGFPGYASVRRVALLREPWTVDNGLLTPTLKLKRNSLVERYASQVDALYQGH
ncbi:MAG: long-chain fatty acid--CoA ligase [Gammaproteobacteria bacterium]|nr:long-chain fatty acid--CoA ligase [Gammaproteobacteria bacterium]